jgi:hypothetical protein
MRTDDGCPVPIALLRVLFIMEGKKSVATKYWTGFDFIIEPRDP